MKVTAYCACGKCCGWSNRGGVPKDHRTGKRKVVGKTSSGVMAGKGTAAADLRYYGYGTKMNIPGYGTVCIQDKGSAIMGKTRIEIFFPTHRQALRWGVRYLNVEVKR